MRALSRLAVLSLAGLALVACDDTGKTAASNQNLLGGAPQPVAPTTQASTQSLISLMIGAASGVSFSGVRRYEAYSVVNGQTEPLIYRESVASDGAGQFAVDPLDLIDPVLPAPDEAQFLLLQQVRAGLFFRYRDLVVRDEDSFFQNYSAVDAGTTVQFLGRTCAELTIQLLSGATNTYVLTVDVGNGLVLKAREELLDGTLVSLSEFETLALDPDLSSAVFHQPVNSEVPLDLDLQSATADLGFAPRPPKQLPSGWKLLEFSKVIDPIEDRPWAKFVYTDGLELIFLVQAKPNLVHQLDGAPPGPPYKTETVTTSSIGLWTVLHGNIQGRELVAMGKVDRLVLADLIQSTL